MGGFLAGVFQQVEFAGIKFAFNAYLRQFFQLGQPVGKPGRRVEQAERAGGVDYFVQHRDAHACNLLDTHLDVLHLQQRGVELAPQGQRLVIRGDALFQLLLQFVDVVLGFLHLQAQGTLLVLDGRQGAHPHLQVFLQKL